MGFLAGGSIEEGRNSIDREEEAGYFREWEEMLRQRHVWGTERFRVAEIWYMIGHERKQIWGNLAATRSWILGFSLLSPTGILKHRSF